MDSEEFEKLLSVLDPDREKAGVRYENIRSRLITLFRCRGCQDVEILADATLDTLARRLYEGEPVRNPKAYAAGVARRLASGWHKKKESVSSVETSPDRLWRGASIETAQDPHPSPEQVRCLEACIGKLPVAEQRFVHEYYRLDEQRRIAAQSTAARVRAFRIRSKLRGCVEDCIRDGKDSETKALPRH